MKDINYEIESSSTGKCGNKMLIFLVFILIIAAITNPSKQEYVSWAKEQIVSKSSSSLEQGLVGLLGQPIIESMTTSRNFIFFSIYETRDGEKYTMVLGAFKNFILIPNVIENGQSFNKDRR